ncbi:MAG: hypothetical protein ACI9H1_000943 [Polaribacter sp.]
MNTEIKKKNYKKLNTIFMKELRKKINNGHLPSFEVEIGQYVIWENEDNVPHQINSDFMHPDFKFDIGVIFPGESSSPVLFNSKKQIKDFRYGCGLTPNLTGQITIKGEAPESDFEYPSGHHHMGMREHDHLKHFHGFVTGGKTGDQIYLTHTPIFADTRHHFQIILECSFVEQEHIDAYNELRASNFGDGKVDLFFDHLALIDIQSGALKELDIHSLRYHIDLKTEIPNVIYRGAKVTHPKFNRMDGANAKVKIKRVLHFRTFTPDMPHPDALTYLMYGNGKDVFIDYFISRAPNIHTVAKLAKAPDFWKTEHHNDVLKFSIPSKKIIDVGPKKLQRVSFLDNQYHLIWGAPSGYNSKVDPLQNHIQNSNENWEYEVKLEDGTMGNIEIKSFTHYNSAGLLNDGLGF